MNDVQQQIRQIQLYSKRLIHANLFGHSRSSQKGSSLEFDQLRDYQQGDDVRAIDWNSSARMNKLLLKQFYDERQRTILIALDISASAFYGSDTTLKVTIARQIAALLAYAAFLAKDEVGLFLFSDTKEWYIPPRKGRAQVSAVLEKIFSFEPRRAQTNFKTILEQLASLRKKNAMLFVISDFIDENFESSLSNVAYQYDTIAIKIIDAAETALPFSGFITVQDPETAKEYILKASAALETILNARIDAQNKEFARHRIDCLHVTMRQPLIDQLIHFFHARKR